MKLSFHITPCSLNDFETVKVGIEKMWLDDEALNPVDFKLAKHNNQVIGFARKRIYTDCTEICSLGVFKNNRLKGVATKLVEELAINESLPIYVVTIIPDFFMKQNFEIVHEYPSDISKKLNRCNCSFDTGDTYHVMLLNK